jgi:hypothetical protein
MPKHDFAPCTNNTPLSLPICLRRSPATSSFFASLINTKPFMSKRYTATATHCMKGNLHPLDPCTKSSDADLLTTGTSLGEQATRQARTYSETPRYALGGKSYEPVRKPI